MATTVDILSEGRLRLRLGCGWHEEEHASYGFEFPDVNTRIDMLDEGLRIAKAMFTEREPTFDGEHFSIEGAKNEPKPVSDPHPPIVVGGAGPRMLRLVAHHADEWNVEINARARGKPIEFKCRKLTEYAKEAGRDPESIDRSRLAHVLVYEDERRLAACEDRIFPLPWGEESDVDDTLRNAEAVLRKSGMLIGTPSQIATQIEEIHALGFEKLQLMFLDFPETEGMELFADEVMPEFE